MWVVDGKIIIFISDNGKNNSGDSDNNIKITMVIDDDGRVDGCGDKSNFGEVKNSDGCKCYF